MSALSPLAWKLIGFAVIAAIIFGSGIYARGKWDAGTIANQNLKIAILTNNQASLSQGLASCDASIKGLAKAGDAQTAAAQKAVDAAQKAAASIDEARKRLASVPFSVAVCPTVQDIYAGAFRP